MKKTYIQPATTIIVLSETLCSLFKASVVHGDDGSHVDNIDVVEENESASMDWDADSWGGE